MAAKRVRTAGALILAVTGFTSGIGFAQVSGPASLGYKLTVLGEDANGTAVLQTGDIFSLKTGGILGVSPDKMVTCPATYQNGALHKPSMLCSTLIKESSAYFQPGLKVYVTRLDVNLKKAKITLRLVACDSCNGTEPPSYYKSEVDFQFAKGYLETAQPAAVKEMIAQVMATESGGTPPPSAGLATQPPAAPTPPPPPPLAPPPPPVEEKPLPPVAPPPPPPAEPTTIELGQTTEKVVASFEKPERIVKLATKQIYYYKDLKVTFVNNKVADVQ